MLRTKEFRFIDCRCDLHPHRLSHNSGGGGGVGDFYAEEHTFLASSARCREAVKENIRYNFIYLNLHSLFMDIYQMRNKLETIKYLRLF